MKGHVRRREAARRPRGRDDHRVPLPPRRPRRPGAPRGQRRQELPGQHRPRHGLHLRRHRHEGRRHAARRDAAADREGPAQPGGDLPLHRRRGRYPRRFALLSSPDLLRPSQLLGLQRIAGNRAVQRLFQARLEVGAAGDNYEQEAERVAEEVMKRLHSPGSERSAAAGGYSAPAGRGRDPTKLLAASISRCSARKTKKRFQTSRLQRQEDEEEIQTSRLQRQEDEAEIQTSRLQRRAADPAGSFEAPAAVEQRLATAAAGLLCQANACFHGAAVRRRLRAVRVHTGNEAANLNRQVSAQAFTHGQDIYMGEGKYDPGSTAGKRLLAHELTHVVQQTSGPRRLALGSRAPGFERAIVQPKQIQRWTVKTMGSPEGHEKITEDSVRQYNEMAREHEQESRARWRANADHQQGRHEADAERCSLERYDATLGGRHDGPHPQIPAFVYDPPIARGQASVPARDGGREGRTGLAYATQDHALGGVLLPGRDRRRHKRRYQAQRRGMLFG